MARTLNLATHTIRREAFVDAALRLMQAKGYEQMSIQDVLDALSASRGAFYHYFDSKQALLEAMVDRIGDQALAEVSSAVEEPGLGAVTRLHRFFAGIGQWKTERKALMLEMVKVWLSDDNAVVREKVRRTMFARVSPILARLIAQGMAEEVFSVTSSAEDTATVVMALMTGFQDHLTDLFVARQADAISFEAVQRVLAGYTEALERILGAPAGSITLADERIVREWFG
jgi:AcrR family transcriptional regulator